MRAQAPGAGRRCRRRRRRRPAAGQGRNAIHGKSDQPRLSGRRSARRAPELRRDQRPQHGHRPEGAPARSTWRCATSRGTRRSTSSCAPTGSATAWTARSSGLRRSTCSPPKTRREAQRPTAAADAGQLTTLTRQLSYSKGEEIVALLKQANILSSRGQAFGRPPDEHADHHRPSGSADQRVGADRHDRQAAAAGRDRSAHRADEQELRAGARHPVGVQRHRLAGSSATRRTWRFPTAERSAADWATQGPARHVDRREPPCGRRGNSAVGLQLGSVNGAFNLDVALSALEELGQRPPAVHAEGVHAEQRRGRNGAGRADSDSDLDQQHGHGLVQGRGADVEGDAADYRGQHGHHADRARERDARLRAAGQRHSADQHPARQHHRARPRRADDGHRRHLHQLVDRTPRIQTPGLGSIPLLGWLFKRESITDQNTELLIFITPRIIRNLMSRKPMRMRSLVRWCCAGGRCRRHRVVRRRRAVEPTRRSCWWSIHWRRDGGDRAFCCPT